MAKSLILKSTMTTVGNSSMEETEDDVPFHEMGLDDRILKAIAKCGWSQPTAIQEKAIPLILEGKKSLILSFFSLDLVALKTMLHCVY